MVLSGTEEGSTATYSCVTGFSLNGQATRECGDDGEWSGSEPTCESMIVINVIL